MENKYVEALNNISSYEIYHEGTYDDGYFNFDDYTEYPFDESEDIKVLSELIEKYDYLKSKIISLIEACEKQIEEQESLIKVGKSFNVNFEDISYDNEIVKAFLEKLKEIVGENLCTEDVKQ